MKSEKEIDSKRVASSSPRPCSVGELSTTVHDLKTLPPYFEKVVAGEKTFEIRKDDRSYQRGDILLLREYDPEVGYTDARHYTGREIKVRVTYITTFEQKEGIVVMAFSPLNDQGMPPTAPKSPNK